MLKTLRISAWFLSFFFFLSAWFQQNENRCDLKYRKQWEDSEYRWNMGRNFWQEEWFWATKNSFYNLEKGLGLSSQQFYRMKDRDCWGKLSFMCLTYVISPEVRDPILIGKKKILECENFGSLVKVLWWKLASKNVTHLRRITLNLHNWQDTSSFAEFFILFSVLCYL